MSESQKITWTNERRKLSQLIPWARNPRRLQEAQERRLGESLEEFAQVELVAIGPDNAVYNGHGRLKAWAKSHGDIEIEVRVSSRSLTEKEREKLTALLHRGATGDWDFDLLATFDPAELVEWGFSEWELGVTTQPTAAPTTTKPATSSESSDRFFDASSLPDGATGTVNQSFILYLSFANQDNLNAGLRALSFGERTGIRGNEKFAVMMGERFLDRWQNAMGLLPLNAEEPEETGADEIEFHLEGEDDDEG